MISLPKEAFLRPAVFGSYTAFVMSLDAAAYVGVRGSVLVSESGMWRV
jgi:hypothetical protein